MARVVPRFGSAKISLPWLVLAQDGAAADF